MPKLEETYQRVKEGALTGGEHIFGRGTALHLRAQEGSYKQWLTVLWLAGSTLWGAAATYSDVKKGAMEFAEDASKFAECVYRQLPDLRLPGTDAVTQARRATPGQVLRLLDEIEAVQRDLPALSRAEMESRLGHIRARLQRLSGSLPPQDMEGLLGVIQDFGIPGLPSSAAELPPLQHDGTPHNEAFRGGLPPARLHRLPPDALPMAMYDEDERFRREELIEINRGQRPPH